MTICDILNSNSIDNPSKIVYLMEIMDDMFPELEGDQVAFIEAHSLILGKRSHI